jgi:hypothetical protein
MTRFPLHSYLPATLALVMATGFAWIQNSAIAEECGEFGTSVIFADSPIEAAKQALKEEKLVFMLHVSGLFEDSDFT